MRQRLARLWPAHITWLIIAIVVMGYPIEWGKLFLNASMLHAWSLYRADFYSYNAVSWSISTEMALYCAFPFLVVGFRKNWPLKLAICIIVYLVVYLYALNFPYSDRYDTIQMGSFLYAFPPSRLAGFCMGMVGCLLWLDYQETLRKINPWVIELGATALILGTLWLTRRIPTVQWLVPLLMAAAFSIGLIAFAEARGRLSDLLSWKPLVFLGEISFSVYISHMVVLNGLARWGRTEGSVWVTIDPYIRFFIILMTVVATSTATYYLVEIPFRRLINAGAERLKSSRLQSDLETGGN
jgi:peptidoglycan/LPS O-acetylase OafA/YrhL